MRNPQGVSRCVFLSTAVIVAGMIGSPVPARAGSLGALVPAYFYPGTGGPGGVGDGWAAMAAAASQIPVTAILNPNSGPLPGPPDPNYVNAMTNLENAGGTAVAYVFTNYGNAPLATVEGEITTYISQYGKLINGFFLDGMSTNPAEISPYYQPLYAYIKGLFSSYQVIGNPGTNTDEGYLKAPTADILVTYENNTQVQSYLTYQPSPWVFNYSSSHFANIIYNQPNAQGSDSMVTDVNLAFFHNNTGSVYVTDQTLPNPYGQLPSYWNQEVTAIASVPEPAALVLLASGCLLSSLVIAVRRRGRERGGR
jgi:hypothetical protein